MTVAEELAVGLTHLRGAFYYKETKRRWGANFPNCLLGQAEAKFMTKLPTRAIVDEGLVLLRDSWAYEKTKEENPAAFSKTLMGKAEASFVRARNMLPTNIVGLGLFALNGVFAVNPRGGVEDADIYAAAGFKWASANVGDHGVEEWEAWRIRMHQHGLAVIPWRRCYTRALLEELVAVARQWGSSSYVANVENPEATTNVNPYVIADVIDRNKDLRCGVLTEPWLQNGAGWGELGQRNVVALCETFLNVDPRWMPKALQDHARAEGMPLFHPTFGAGIWNDAPYDVPPSTYFAAWPTGPYSVWPIDGKNAMEWKRP